MTGLLKKIINNLFYITLLTYSVYFVLELVKEGLISNYFDLNLLLLFVILCGISDVVVNRKSE